MTQNPDQPAFTRLRERRVREPNVGSNVYDLTNPESPSLVGMAFTFFGRPDFREVVQLSHQWLSEITIAKDERQKEEIETAALAEKASLTALGQQLNLTMDYSCSAVGQGLRILTSDLVAKASKTYSYIIVDEADLDASSPMLVSEVWIAESGSPAADTLTPLGVRGKKLLSPGKDAQLVQWEAIAYRVLTKS